MSDQADRQATMLRRIVIIGVGNDYRGDDAVGLVVARRLLTQVSAPVTVREESGEGAALMQAWAGATLAIICDAMFSGAQPGAIRRIAAHQEAVPAGLYNYSSHAFSLAEAVELARALGELPQQIVIYGIEGRVFAAGIGLS